jgi:excisionase family DNA binding protein
MSEKRLQDWIKYVQTHTEEVPGSIGPSSGGHPEIDRTPDSKPRQTRQRLKPETRAQLLERLINPQITLHEASVLLKVCPATVRRYTQSGRLPDIRTAGGQRRFRFRDVMALARELDKKK